MVCAAQGDQTPRVTEAPQTRFFDRFLAPYRSRAVSNVSFGDSPRIDNLVRAGVLYLSLQDAIAMVLENNLDVELQRFNIPIAGTDVERTKGGGLTRGVNLTVTEPPAGVGSPSTPLLNAAATGTTPTANVQANVADLTFIQQTQTNLSVVGATPFATGPAIPTYDPAIIGTLSWQHATTQETNTLISGTPSLVAQNVLGNVSLQQGFGLGTEVALSFNNSNTNSNSTRSDVNPYVSSSLGFTVTQPLLRGFGTSVNRRFIRIAKNNEKVADLVFKQQVITTVAGVIRLYYDLVSWTEDVRVKEETLALAQRLLRDNEDQVRQGTLAPIEITRAQAQVAAAEQDLANSLGFRQQQELILKSYLTRRGTADPAVRNSRVVATDPIPVVPTLEVQPSEDVVQLALQNRPDLAQAGIQVTNSQITLQGSRNAVLPEIDLFATAANSGLAGSSTTTGSTGAGSVLGTPGTGGSGGSSGLTSGTTGTATTDTSYVGSYGSALGQIFRRNYPSYGVGIQLNLPLRNRQAVADLVRDELQLRQTQVRRQQIENQIRLEVENALVTLQRTRAAYEASTRSRVLQEQSLASEQEKYQAGLSTSFLVIQYQSYLAQARSTEVAAKSAYIKAQTALDRAVGTTLERNNVSFDEAKRGDIKRAPTPLPLVP